MKTSTYITQQSDFLTDLAMMPPELLKTLFRMSKRFLRHSSRMAMKGLRWLWSDQGQFALIILMGLTVISLQLRSLL